MNKLQNIYEEAIVEEEGNTRTTDEEIKKDAVKI